MPAAAEKCPAEPAEPTKTDLASVYVDAEGRICLDRRRTDRRGTAIRVYRFHGERRIGERRGASERRGLPRATLCLEFEEQHGPLLRYLYSVDVGVRGVSVAHAIPHPPGTTVLLRFALPGEESRPIRSWAVVVGRKPNETGIAYRFIGMSRGDTERVADFVRKMALEASVGERKIG